MRLPLAEEIVRRLGRRGSPFASLAQASDAPYMPSEVPTDDPRLGVDYGDSTSLPLPKRLPALPGNEAPPVNVQPRLRSTDLQGQLNTMDQPISRKGTLLKAVMSAAPIAVGGLLGGSVGASGAASGVEDYNAEQMKTQELRRKNLQDELDKERQRDFEAQQSGLSRQASATQSQSKLDEDMRQFNETQARIREENAANRANQQTIEGMKTASAQDIAATKAQADADYKKAQTELAEARRQTEIAKANPNSPIYRMAQERLATAERNAQTAATRLGLSQQQFEMRAFGTNQGQALPGALLTDDNRPVGSSFSANVRPTGTERVRGDMASSAREQLSDIVGIVQRHPEVFGPLSGRTTDLSVWAGSQDPDAQAFRAARTIAGDHLAGTFGGRSEPALAALDDAIGRFKDNPEAMLSGIKQLDKAAKTFEDKGRVRTAGSAGAGVGTTIKVISPDGKTGTIPFEDWPQAQKEGYKRAPK